MNAQAKPSDAVTTSSYSIKELGEEDRPKMDLSSWTEQNLRLDFQDLLNKVKPPLKTDVPMRVLNLCLAIGCLNSEYQQFSGSFNAFLADKDFQQAKRQIVHTMKSETFNSPFCENLKGEL